MKRLQSYFMRVPLITGIAVAIGQFLMVGFAQAQCSTTGLPGVCVTDVQQFITYVMCQVAFWMFALLIPLAVVYVLLAAYGYLTSGGDENQVSDATKKITYAAVAVAVALLAKAFPFIVATIVSTGALSSVGVTGC